MKNTNCGYYYFGMGLGNALIDQNQQQFDLNFYLHKRTRYRFDERVNIIYLSKLHNLYFPLKNKFDVVHFSDQECRLRPWKVNAKKIMTIHDMNKVHLLPAGSAPLQKYLQKLGTFIEKVDKIVTISEFVAKDVKHYFPRHQEKVSVIYNGADELSVTPGHLPALAPQKPFLFTIGVLTAQKGAHLLPSLLQDNDYELVIAGPETPHKQVIIEEARRYGCLDRVHITGPITDKDKAWYYQNCSAFLFPSRSEGFGLPVIEAMHFGKPVFLSRYTSLPEVGGNAAYYFDSFDPAHMQDVFNAGMKDFSTADSTQKIIAQAEKFSWETAAKQYLELYEACLSAS
ncbi:glycosyltransferase family 4 protein [Mucilaginibacter sp. RS28]|uniref:Glycosyltransferase family 4 protein n=1 Tax=Mucilaginibacter straminoryzae TaxID=2932774 RepID=A0A9X1X0A5_9SPHI|nr:glycosyltransferase family 1 protein [Mucilaginibacter straminoryzae]MCJ8208436.1 glycosyltransferase family 4 protein [Mucilaginibacter straminoryzae]